MDNKDNDITLSKNKDTSLMGVIRIKTADSDTLRYYIYKAVTIEGAAAAAIVSSNLTIPKSARVVIPIRGSHSAEKIATEAATAAPAEAAPSVETKAAETAETAPAAEKIATEAAPSAATTETAPSVEKKAAEASPAAAAANATAPAETSKTTKKQGQIADDVPSEMYVSQSYTITAYITKDLRENVTQQLNWERKPTVNVTRVTDRMMVTLEGDSDDFYIKSLGDAIQNITEEENATWQWNVKPLMAGNKRLSVVAKLVFSNGDTKLLTSYKHDVAVSVSGEGLLVWLQKNWQWVAGALATTIFALAGFFKWLYPLIKPLLKGKEQGGEEKKKE
jgi:hypothetical protein